MSAIPRLLKLTPPPECAAPGCRDDAINIARWPVSGLFMPDELKSFRCALAAQALGGMACVAGGGCLCCGTSETGLLHPPLTAALRRFQGAHFVVGANEGDARDWPGGRWRVNWAALLASYSTTAAHMCWPTTSTSAMPAAAARPVAMLPLTPLRLLAPTPTKCCPPISHLVFLCPRCCQLEQGHRPRRTAFCSANPGELLSALPSPLQALPRRPRSRPPAWTPASSPTLPLWRTLLPWAA